MNGDETRDVRSEPVAAPADATSGVVGGADTAGVSTPLAVQVMDAVMRRSGTGVVLFDDELRYVMVNEVAAGINGVPVEEHIGRSAQDVVPEVAVSLAPVLEEVLRTGEPALNIEATGETSSAPGETRWWNTNVVRIEDAASGDRFALVVFTEVTEQRRAHQRLRQLIDNLFTFVGLLSREGDILEINKAALAAAGVALPEVEGRAFWEAPWWRHDDAIRDRIRDAISVAAGGRAVRHDVSVSLADGRVIPIDFQLAPITERGVVVALVPSGLDIADRVEEASKLASLAVLSNRLNAAETNAEVIDAIVTMSSAIEGASLINVALVDAEEQLLRIAMEGVDAEVTERWSTTPLVGPEPTPFHEAITTGEMVVVASRADRHGRFPALLPDADLLGLQMTVAVPLFGEDGDVIGAVGLGWTDPVELSDEVRSRLLLLQNMCSRAFQRTRRSEVLSEFVAALQSELLVEPGQVETSFDVAVHYRPATHDIGFGGDWYDIVPRGDATAFVVGDVVGHGITAASQMAHLKGLLRGLVISTDLDDVIATATSAMPEVAGYLATAAIAVFDPVNGRIRYALAGHPPPLLQQPDGRVSTLDRALTTPIGLRSGSVPAADVRAEPGSLLVMYTDGLVERGRRPLDDGLRVLTAVVGAIPPDVDALTARDTIMDAMLGDHPNTDDVAIITVRMPGGSAAR